MPLYQTNGGLNGDASGLSNDCCCSTCGVSYECPYPNASSTTFPRNYTGFTATDVTIPAEYLTCTADCHYTTSLVFPLYSHEYCYCESTGPGEIWEDFKSSTQCSGGSADARCSPNSECSVCDEQGGTEHCPGWSPSGCGGDPAVEASWYFGAWDGWDGYDSSLIWLENPDFEDIAVYIDTAQMGTNFLTYNGNGTNTLLRVTFTQQQRRFFFSYEYTGGECRCVVSMEVPSDSCCTIGEVAAMLNRQTWGRGAMIASNSMGIVAIVGIAGGNRLVRELPNTGAREVYTVAGGSSSELITFTPPYARQWTHDVYMFSIELGEDCCKCMGPHYCDGSESMTNGDCTFISAEGPLFYRQNKTDTWDTTVWCPASQGALTIIDQGFCWDGTANLSLDYF